MSNNGSEGVSKFKVAFYVQCIGLPLMFILTYSVFAGGLFNGFAGAPQAQGMINGAVLIQLVFPVIGIVGYVHLVFRFINFRRSRNKYSSGTPLMVMATILTLLIIFWNSIVT